ncbi:MAG: hypothetical protein FWC65_02705 [Treponema sp.]|nr:hypothetical protein [Treponema sp.]
MTAPIRALGARLRNLFQSGEFRRRYDDDRIQVETYNKNVVEKAESFPYGFYAKAKNGRALVFCQGGNTSSFEIFPLLPGKGVTPPKLAEGDAALYTASGGWIICRENGSVELFGRDYGGVIKADELRRQLAALTARVDGIMNALKASPTVPADGGASFKAGIVGALNAIANREDFSSIASDKVFHGSGN